MSFTPKSINDINDDFLKNMQEKYGFTEDETKDPSQVKVNETPPVKVETDTKKLSPFDSVRPVIVRDENDNARVVTLAELENEKHKLKGIDKAAPKAVKSEIKEDKAPKAQPQNKETEKKEILKTVVEKPKQQVVAPNTNLNKSSSEKKPDLQGIKHSVKREIQEENTNPILEPPKATEPPKTKEPPKTTEPQKEKEPPKAKESSKVKEPSMAKEHLAPKKEVSKEKTVTAPKNEQQDDTYNDYLQEFLGILSTPDKKENKNIIKKNVQPTNQKKAIKEKQADKEFSQKLDEKINEQYEAQIRESEEHKPKEMSYDKYFLANSHAAFAKEQRLRRFFISGCVLLITSILSIAILFTMSRFIPAREIVEQSKKNEEIVEVNGQGNPQYSNETRIECSFVESYSFSAFINTYYLHWAVVLSLGLLGASIVCFSIYVRELGTGEIIKFITSKKRKE